MFRRRLRILVEDPRSRRDSAPRTPPISSGPSSHSSLDSHLASGHDSFPSSATVSASWPGIANINKLVIFGDSYSQTTPHYATPHPTKSDPLGVPWPGTTSTKPGEPNWLGHLVTNYSINPDLLIFNYAVSGSTLCDAKTQLSDRAGSSFEHHLVRHKSRYPWTSQDTLFVCWFGINDLAHNMSSAGRSLYTTEAQLLLLFELHAALYKRGARNFLIINVPPVHASPAWQRSADASQLRIRDWNTKLQKVADQFCSAHPAATVLIFSSWDCLNAVFDEPRKHGFDPSDVERPYGGIWVDNLHLTSNVHDFIARDVYQFLESVQAGG